MAHAIPEPFVWDETFRVFYDGLDEEHKGLFKGVFDVAAKPSCGATLGNLVDVVKKHFANEEGMMQSKGYADFPSHKQAHDDFVAKISGLATPVSNDSVHFAKNWLVNHIKETDFKYKGKL